MKPTLLIDMDGVFCDWVGSYYAVLGEKYPSAVQWFPPMEELTEFYVGDNLTDDRARHIEDLICQDINLYRNALPYPGAIEGLKALREEATLHGIELFICTAPHPANKYCYTQKAEWIAKYLGDDWLDLLIMTRDKTVIRGHVLLDDKPDPMGGQSPTWSHVLFTQPCNKNIMKPRVDDLSKASRSVLINMTLHKHQHPTRSISHPYMSA